MKNIILLSVLIGLIGCAQSQARKECDAVGGNFKRASHINYHNVAGATPFKYKGYATCEYTKTDSNIIAGVYWE